MEEFEIIDNRELNKKALNLINLPVDESYNQIITLDIFEMFEILDAMYFIVGNLILSNDLKSKNIYDLTKKKLDDIKRHVVDDITNINPYKNDIYDYLQDIKKISEMASLKALKDIFNVSALGVINRLQKGKSKELKDNKKEIEF